MYILIMEDGTVYQAGSVSEDDLRGVDDGILQIIDISGDTPKEYYDGIWNGLPEYRG